MTTDEAIAAIAQHNGVVLALHHIWRVELGTVKPPVGWRAAAWFPGAGVVADAGPWLSAGEALEAVRKRFLVYEPSGWGLGLPVPKASTVDIEDLGL